MARFEPPGDGRRVDTPAGYTLTIADVAVRLEVIPTTLKRWRDIGVGPSWYKGQHATSPIFYREAEVAEAVRAYKRFLKSQSKREVRSNIDRANKASRGKTRARR